jgi:hypothetical protein
MYSLPWEEKETVRNYGYHLQHFVVTSTNLPTVKKPTITETIRLHRLRWFGHVQRMEENRIPKTVLYRVFTKEWCGFKN